MRAARLYRRAGFARKPRLFVCRLKEWQGEEIKNIVRSRPVRHRPGISGRLAHQAKIHAAAHQEVLRQTIETGGFRRRSRGLRQLVEIITGPECAPER